ncbi:MAG: hypothetical protein ACJ8J0_18380 [Longimicrobiaceae bacterium]
MRSHSIRFGFILLSAAAAVAAACTTAHRVGLPRRSEARVRVHGDAGAGRLVTSTLLDCRAMTGSAHGNVAAVRGRPSVARNGLGDVLQLPADAVPAGTDVKVSRGSGRPYRWVDASAGTVTPTPPATLTIDLHGCTHGATDLIIVRWVPALSAWDSVGGVVTDSTITVSVPHLSVYAVAGG